jgi:hypothetical protein
MTFSNPFLGPAFVPLAEIIQHIIEELDDWEHFSIQTYIKSYGHDPYRSPYVQGLYEEDGSLHVELSGNLQVSPPLTEKEYEVLEFLGWTRPEVTEEEYEEGTARGIPNFVRIYDEETPRNEIVEFILESLVLVFGLTIHDFWNFDRHTATVANLGKLQRLPRSETRNVRREIFALPDCIIPKSFLFPETTESN